MEDFQDWGGVLLVAPVGALQSCWHNSQGNRIWNPNLAVPDFGRGRVDGRRDGKNSFFLPNSAISCRVRELGAGSGLAPLLEGRDLRVFLFLVVIGHCGASVAAWISPCGGAMGFCVGL